MSDAVTLSFSGKFDLATKRSRRNVLEYLRSITAETNYPFEQKEVVMSNGDSQTITNIRKFFVLTTTYPIKVTITKGVGDPITFDVESVIQFTAAVDTINIEFLPEDTTKQAHVKYLVN